jgi:hypothetical protein
MYRAAEHPRNEKGVFRPTILMLQSPSFHSWEAALMCFGTSGGGVEGQLGVVDLLSTLLGRPPRST